jgi:uncharacterized damage-inducible protein DinB
MDREELSQREATGWADLQAAVARLTPEERDRSGINADGWSVKDVLWHVAHWLDDLSRMLEEMRAGTFADDEGSDEETDAENSRVLAESRSMALADVGRALEEAHERMLAAWARLPEVTEAAQKWFVWETIEHYEEHLPEVLASAPELGR